MRNIWTRSLFIDNWDSFCCFWKRLKYTQLKYKDWMRLHHLEVRSGPAAVPIWVTMEETRALFWGRLLPLVYCWKIDLLLHNVDCLMLEIRNPMAVYLPGVIAYNRCPRFELLALHNHRLSQHGSIRLWWSNTLLERTKIPKLDSLFHA